MPRELLPEIVDPMMQIRRRILLGVQRNARLDTGREDTPPMLKIVETAVEGKLPGDPR